MRVGAASRARKKDMSQELTDKNHLSSPQAAVPAVPCSSTSAKGQEEYVLRMGTCGFWSRAHPA